MIVDITLGRVSWCIKKLADPQTKQSDRFECYRIAIAALRDAHEAEVRQVDELNSVKADPNIEALTGSPVV